MNSGDRNRNEAKGLGETKLEDIRPAFLYPYQMARERALQKEAEIAAERKKNRDDFVQVSAGLIAEFNAFQASILSTEDAQPNSRRDIAASEAFVENQGNINKFNNIIQTLKKAIDDATPGDKDEEYFSRTLLPLFSSVLEKARLCVRSTRLNISGHNDTQGPYTEFRKSVDKLFTEIRETQSSAVFGAVALLGTVLTLVVGALELVASVVSFGGYIAACVKSNSTYTSEVAEKMMKASRYIWKGGYVSEAEVNKAVSGLSSLLFKPENNQARPGQDEETPTRDNKP